MNKHLREPENKHKIEYSNGWCGTCDDQAKPNSNNILHIMQIISSIQFMGNKIYSAFYLCATETQAHWERIVLLGNVTYIIFLHISFISAPGYCGPGASSKHF